MNMQEVLILSLVTASISFTVTETKLFKPFRDWAGRKGKFFGELSACSYCFGHWIAFGLVAVYKPILFNSAWRLLDYFLVALVIAWFSIFQVLILCWLMENVGK
jgi:hypothetical protein